MSSAGAVRAPARAKRAGQAPLFEPARREGAGRGPAPGERRPRPGGGRLTLERQLVSAWEGLLAAGVAECPVCRGPMMRRAGETARCGGCGSELG